MGPDADPGQLGELDAARIHAADDLGGDVHGRRSGKDVLAGHDGHVALVGAPCFDLGQHVLADHVAGGGLFQGHLALQQGQPLAQLLLALFFRAFFQFFLIGGQAVLQDGLDLAQMLVGLLRGLGLAEDAFHIHADHVRAGVQATGQGQGQHEGKAGQKTGKMGHGSLPWSVFLPT